MLSESVKHGRPDLDSRAILVGVVKLGPPKSIAIYRSMSEGENIAAQAVRRFRDLGRIT
ncbi:hypothetical protein J2Z31_002216 [Sinorhizobium kostiense]|uniref:Transposase n=1 Tax=Sinorhizobium kostiense TaxID=76747 RepID=A0ABS4R053_9HYPH|nr:hypothetical protein [Sinorhizobium kostiense]